MVTFDLSKLGEYREHNQLEAKKAKGGFPRSFWETYSAFANTDGGIILLGVNEAKDGSLHPEDVDVEKLQKDFWNMVNNRQKISANIVTQSMVKPMVLDGKNILVVRVPRAERSARPVYVGMDPKSGTFRRNHEGDYHCSLDEMSLMFRDAAHITQDAKVLDKMDMSVFCMDTVRGYRNFFRSTHSNHLWNNEDDEMFLRKIGAIGIGEDGMYHPTAAGLLMFGYEYEITREFPNYFLDYQENRSLGATRWTDRIVSTSGDWSGNVFDFVIEALRRMQQGLKVPFVLKGNLRVDDTPLHKLLREAVTNMVVHADFYGRQGLVIQKSEDGYRLSNPGSIRISVTEAINGGVSDPRNGVMLKIFSLIEFGERAGSGLSGICKVWEMVFHTRAKIDETHRNGVDRTILTLSTGGNEQDVNAMLDIYGDMIEDVESKFAPSKPYPCRMEGDTEFCGVCEPVVPFYTSKEYNDLDQEADQETWHKPINDQETDKKTRYKRQIDQETGQETKRKRQIDQETGQETKYKHQTDQETDQETKHKHQTDQETKRKRQTDQETDEKDKIYQLIKSNPKITRSEIAKIIGIHDSSVKRRIESLVSAGLIRRVGSTKGGHWDILRAY